MSIAEERVRMLGDPSSVYFRQVEGILKDQIAAEERAEAARETVVLPVAVSPSEKAELARIFRWKLDIKDYGLSFRGVPYVSALVFLMSLRNFMLMGMDGEEAICIDGDLAALVAKGLTYGHVCRTHATPRLSAGYMHETAQLQKLSMYGNKRISEAAKAALQMQEAGDSTRLCHNAATCRRNGDTVFFNHAVTPASLAQVVATAKAHGASVARGVALFQPEMLTMTTGKLQAFPGSFVVDRQSDIISYLPAADESMGFSHPYSSLVSLFVNHEYVSGDDRWLVEKHLSGNGVYHYLCRREKVVVRMPEALSANYYSHELTKWVELTYTTFVGEDGSLLRNPRRVKVRVLESCYEKTMSVLMYIDVKSLTRDKVFSLLKSNNNMAVCGGDTVTLPERVWYEELRRASVPMHSQAMVRRAAASQELRVALDSVKRRFSLRDATAAGLFYATLSAVGETLGGIALGCLGGTEIGSLDKLVAGGVDMSVLVERSSDKVEVRHTSGSDNFFSCGRMERWLPAPKGRNISLLARARGWVSKAAVSVVSSESNGSETARATFVDDSGVGEASGVPFPVEVGEKVDASRVSAPFQGSSKELYESLVAKQDAFSVKPPRRVVESFIGPTREDVAVVPVMECDPVPIAQQEYDELLPGVSLSDEEMKPVVAAQSDLVVNTNFSGTIDDSKRLVPQPRWVRRSRLRTGGAGRLPGTQSGLFSALRKRNTDVPSNRGFVDLNKLPDKILDSVQRVCYVENWREKLVEELDGGLWQSIESDIAEYVPKVASHVQKRIVDEFVSADAENLYRWLMMVKTQGKPPMDVSAASKVQLPQTIMYSDQKSVNAKYSAIQTRFYRVMKSMLKANVSFNNRDSPAEHEVWFNSCQGVRRSAPRVYGLAGDITCYDRSQEHLAEVVEAMWYKRHGLDRVTLDRWSETHGVKKATSMMYGIVMFLFMQGLSGIWKTLFRNGLMCLGAVVHCAELRPQDIVTLDVVGDDFLAELLRPVDLTRGIDRYALTFNFTVKLMEPSVLEFCSKIWVRVDGWWYFVQNPMRKIESVSNAVVSVGGESGLEEKWVSLRDDLRHYDNAIVMDALAEQVQVMHGFSIPPRNIITALATMAANRQVYFDSFGPEELLV